VEETPAVREMHATEHAAVGTQDDPAAGSLLAQPYRAVGSRQQLGDGRVVLGYVEGIPDDRSGDGRRRKSGQKTRTERTLGLVRHSVEQAGRL
jgi:hypothetical protein